MKQLTLKEWYEKDSKGTYLEGVDFNSLTLGTRNRLWRDYSKYLWNKSSNYDKQLFLEVNNADILKYIDAEWEGLSPDLQEKLVEEQKKEFYGKEKSMKPSEKWNSLTKNERGVFLDENGFVSKYGTSNSEWNELDEDVKQAFVAENLKQGAKKVGNKLKESGKKVKDSIKKGFNKLKSEDKKIEEKIKEEEKTIEKLNDKKEMTHNPYYSKDEYVKINELAPFAAYEFVQKGRLMGLNKAVRGFRDKKGEKVIIYYNTTELQKFIDDNGIHATVFESRDELAEWLQKNFIDTHKPKTKK